MAVAGDAAVGDARGVKELGVDALVALAGALVAREAAFGRAQLRLWSYSSWSRVQSCSHRARA